MRWIHLCGAACIVSLLPSGASAEFIASDFEFVLTTEPTFIAGANARFDGLLTNVSSETAVFGNPGAPEPGENIAGAGISFSFFIGGVDGPASPYFEGISSPPLLNLIIAPGVTAQFPLFFIDTTPTIPPGTIVTLGPGDLLFQNIPPSTPDPFADFSIHFFEVSAMAVPAMAVPEPATWAQFAVGLAGLGWMSRQRKTKG